MATRYHVGVERQAIIGTESEKDSLLGVIPDGSTYFATDSNTWYTYYDGLWYKTMPEAARLLHEDVGTDTRPIKLVGGVATIVANELAEDSKVVHNTGDETVAGVKTFTSELVINLSNAVINLRSTKGSTTNGILSEIRTQIGNVSQAKIYVEQMDGYRQMAFEVLTPLGTVKRGYLRAYDAFVELLIPPYLPTDSGGNPLAPASNVVMNSAMLAVDPRVVHTTGNETIAGTKEFSNTIVNTNSLDNRLIDMLGWTSQTENWWPTYTMTAVSYARGTMVHIVDVNNNLYGMFMFMGYSTNIFAFRYLGSFPVSRVRLARKGSTLTVLVSTQASNNRIWMWCSQDVQSLTGTPHPNAPVLVKITDRTAGAEPVVGDDWDAVITPTER